MTAFDTALAFTWLPHWDGQPLHTTPGDAGGATAWGVTQATWSAWAALHPELPSFVGNASKASLSDMLHAWFWLPVDGDGLPVGVSLMTFDFGITSGPGTAARRLQSVLGVMADGKIGPVTLAAAQAMDPATLCQSLHDAAAAYYGSLGSAEFITGWLDRNDARLAAAQAILAST